MEAWKFSKNDQNLTSFDFFIFVFNLNPDLDFDKNIHKSFNPKFSLGQM